MSLEKGFALGLKFDNHMQALCFLKPYLDYLDAKATEQIMALIESIPDCREIRPFPLNPSDASLTVRGMIHDSPLTDMLQSLIHIYGNSPYSPVGQALTLAVEAIAYKNLLGSTEVKYLINETPDQFHFSVLGIWIEYKRKLISADSPAVQKGRLRLGPWIPEVRLYSFDSP